MVVEDLGIHLRVNISNWNVFDVSEVVMNVECDEEVLRFSLGQWTVVQ